MCRDLPSVMTLASSEAAGSYKYLRFAGGIMSYALDTKETDASKQDQAFNHFVVFDPYDLIACHDFQVLPLPRMDSHEWLLKVTIVINQHSLLAS